MKKIAVITGITGQDGAYLADFLLNKKYQVIGIFSKQVNNNFFGLNFFKIKNKIKLMAGDIRDEFFIAELLKKYQPDEFYNLAGQSSVGKSWADPRGTMEINGRAVETMLKNIKKHSPKTKFLQCSSAEIYGDSRRVVTEKNRQFKPLNPYGKSKLRAHLAVEKFRNQLGLFAVNVILFNHESPLRPDFMVTKKITKGAVRIAKGLDKEIILGNLSSARDWGFAGDFVRAMWLVLQNKSPQDFVVCTGKSYTLKQFLVESFRQVGIKDWKKFVKIDKSFFRAKDVKNMRGSSALLQKKLGWKPKTDFKKLIKILVDFELSQIKK